MRVGVPLLSPLGQRYFAFFTSASIFDPMGRASLVILGFLGCLGLRISRPPLFFGIGSPQIQEMDPVVPRAAVFDGTADATRSELGPAGARASQRRPAAADQKAGPIADLPAPTTTGARARVLTPHGRELAA
jgi:hypothetical protein